MNMRRLAFIAIGLVLAGCNALAQETTTAIPTARNTTPALTKDADQKSWSSSVSAYTCIVPDNPANA
jgi:hypothetical protein